MVNKEITRALFDQALELDSQIERRAYLDRACAADSELRAAVEDLLRSYEQAGEFMARPPAAKLSEVLPALEDLTLTTALSHDTDDPAQEDDSERITDFLLP